ncbi:transposase [Aristaeella hokkaidonensis]|uniref:Transposase n=1 Tax=Aristaeella hokkaidonensis TaxID=3046382 RepID=A0AC61MUQ6_9FIRM|nr:transposase [Aristaeella hokkaidonensis]QUC65777.1 transposase [Aristaeella hokkaidonensis]SNT94012.1 Transposase and inactivated derivatives [Aristaeella hokkaidonensis]
MHKTYSKEFKVKACEMVLKDGMKHAEAAERLGINKILLYQWTSAYEINGEKVFVGKGHQRAEDAELRKRRKENAELKMENEILRKCNSILCEKPDRRVRFAQKELKEYPVSKVCKVLGISRSYYYKVRKPTEE